MLLPTHAVVNCSRYVVPGGGVGIHGGEGRAFFTGLQTCSSVWLCPVCSPRIMHRRRLELEHGLREVKRRGWSAVLVTVTLRHHAGDPLGELLSALGASWTGVRSGALWSQFKARHGVVGDVVALEVTNGREGWHPHKHAVMVLDHVADAEELATMRSWLSDRWQAMIAKAGRWASATWGVDVRGGASAARYLSKLDAELTDQEYKTGAGVGPFGLLALAAEGDQVAAALFREYATAVAGLQRLRWSKGLKTLLGVAELTDAELAAEDEDAVERPLPVLAMLDGSQWAVVCRAEARADLIEVAARGSPVDVWAFLEGLGIERGGWNEAREASDAIANGEYIEVTA